MNQTVNSDVMGRKSPAHTSVGAFGHIAPLPSLKFVTKTDSGKPRRVVNRILTDRVCARRESGSFVHVDECRWGLFESTSRF